MCFNYFGGSQSGHGGDVHDHLGSDGRRDHGYLQHHGLTCDCQAASAALANTHATAGLRHGDVGDAAVPRRGASARRGGHGGRVDVGSRRIRRPWHRAGRCCWRSRTRCTANVRVAYWTKVAAWARRRAHVHVCRGGHVGAMDCIAVRDVRREHRHADRRVRVVCVRARPGPFHAPRRQGGAGAERGAGASSCFAQNAAARGKPDRSPTPHWGFVLQAAGTATAFRRRAADIRGASRWPPGLRDAERRGHVLHEHDSVRRGHRDRVPAQAASQWLPAVNVAFANNATATVTVGGTTAPARGRRSRGR